MFDRDLLGQATDVGLQKPVPYVAMAFDRRGKLLHKTYVLARPANARWAAKAALRLFVTGSFRLYVREATPQMLGAVPVRRNEDDK